MILSILWIIGGIVLIKYGIAFGTGGVGGLFGNLALKNKDEEDD